MLSSNKAMNSPYPPQYHVHHRLPIWVKGAAMGYAVTGVHAGVGLLAKKLPLTELKGLRTLQHYLAEGWGGNFTSKAQWFHHLVEGPVTGAITASIIGHHGGTRAQQTGQQIIN